MIRPTPAFQVINKQLQVNHVRIIGVSSSAVFHIGDTRTINCSSIFDTPPESLIVGPLVPFTV